MKQNIPNYGILNPVPSDPAGFVSTDGEWAAIPCGKKFMIVYKGQQVHTTNSYNAARSYISKHSKNQKKSKKQTSSLENFL